MDKTDDKFYNLSTDKQQEVFDYLFDGAKEEFLRCHKNYLEAQSAIVKLPHINERGEKVQHGCNMRMRRISDYWENRRDAIKEFIDREWVEQQRVSSFCYKR